MSLLGFDALGRWALGQLPSNGNFVLLATQGSVSLSGRASAFGISEAVVTAGTLTAGTSAGFRIAEPASGAPFICVSNATAFTSKMLSLIGSLQVTGVPTNWTARAPASQGAALVLGKSLQFSVSLASQRGAFAWAGADSTAGRDHEAWVRRPFDMASWHVETTLPPPAWNGSTSAAGTWAADVPPANAWTPTLIEPEPWTIE